MARTKKRFNAIKTEEHQKDVTFHQWRVGLYARLSLDSATTGSESISSQINIMHQYLKNHPELIETKEYIDDGYSGTNFSRPSFELMMEDIRRGKINVVIVKDMSRLGRDYLETSNLIETIFPFLGVRFISVNDHFDTKEDQNGNKDLEIAIKNLVNDMYAKDVSKRVYTSRAQDRLQGKVTSVDAPYGYKVNRNHPLRRYEIDEKPAAIVREIFQMALEGKNYLQIIKILQDRRLSIPGLYKRTGSLYLRDEDEQKQWYKGTISNILNNQAYIGTLVQGKRRQRLYKGEKQFFTDEDEWVVIENAHDPIVSREVFDTVQDILHKKITESTFNSDRLKDIPVKPNKYAGLLRCGSCGNPLRYFSFADKSGTKRIYAFCCSRQDGISEKCCVYVRETVLDELVKQSVGNIIRSFNQDMQMDSFMEKAMSSSLAKYKAEKRKLSQLIAKEKQKQTDAYEGYVLGNLTREAYLLVRDNSEENCAQMQEKLSQIKEREAEYISSMNRKKYWLIGLNQCSEGEMDSELLHLLIKEIRIYPKRRIDIHYHFSQKDFETGGNLHE